MFGFKDSIFSTKKQQKGHFILKSGFLNKFKGEFFHFDDSDEDTPKARYNENGFRIDPDGNADLHDLLHRYRSFLDVS